MTAPKNSPVVDSVGFRLLERAADDGGHQITAVERKAIDHALVWLRRGKINAALTILEAAARVQS